MAKELWNKCECGTITDKDEVCCPECGSNPLHLIELDLKEIKDLIEKGKVWTKKNSRWYPQKKPA